METKDKFSLTVEQLIDHLKHHNPKAKVLVSSDEELNTLYAGLQVAELDDEPEPTVVIYGLDGTVVDG